MLAFESNSRSQFLLPWIHFRMVSRQCIDPWPASPWCSAFLSTCHNHYRSWGAREYNGDGLHIKKSTVKRSVVKCSHVPLILRIQISFEFKQHSQHLQRALLGSVDERSAPIPISYINFNIVCFILSQQRNNFRMLVHPCQVQGMIPFVGDFVDLQIRFLTRAQQQLHNFLEPQAGSVMEYSPPVRVLNVYVGSTADQCFYGLQWIVFAKGFQRLDECERPEYSLLRINLLSAGN